MSRAGARRKASRFFEASEPRSFDMRFYARALLVAFIAIVFAAGFAVYQLVFNTAEPTAGPSFDLSSFAVGALEPADPENPCIVLQEHLEATRLKSYEKAYGYLSDALKEITNLEQFIANAKTNALLLRDISGYRFSDFEVVGKAASTSGYMEYESGGRSRVEAAFTREGGSWKISLVTVIYQ